MFEKPQFHIETEETGLNYGRYKIEPLEPGYGTTLGNALRRILLRSLEGVAISRVQIEGVWHEFATINNVREDVVEIVLNLKRVRLKRVTEFNGETRAHLYVRADSSGERVVTAGDVAWPSEVEIINPDQVIATLTGSDAILDMDLWVSRDRGYRPAEHQETYSIGQIPIDAIFTPVQKVNFVVEHTRVGQVTDFDRLILEILTDGTIEPEEALSDSARILMDHARIFADFNRKDTDAVVSSGAFISEEVQSKALADLGLSPRVLNALRSRQIDRVGQVLTMDPDQLLSIRNFGPRSLKELRDKLSEFGYLPEGDTSIFSTDHGYFDALESAMDGEEEDDGREVVVEAVSALGGDDLGLGDDDLEGIER